MSKKTRQHLLEALQKQPPYYIARRLQSVQDLETVLNELRDEGYVIKWVMGGPDTFTVVAVMPEV